MSMSHEIKFIRMQKPEIKKSWILVGWNFKVNP